MLGWVGPLGPEDRTWWWRDGGCQAPPVSIASSPWNSVVSAMACDCMLPPGGLRGLCWPWEDGAGLGIWWAVWGRLTDMRSGMSPSDTVRFTCLGSQMLLRWYLSILFNFIQLFNTIFSTVPFCHDTHMLRVL